MRKIAITITIMVVLLMTYVNFKTIEQNDYTIDKLNYKISKLVETDEVVVNALKDTIMIYDEHHKELPLSVLNSIGIIVDPKGLSSCVAIESDLILTAGHCIGIGGSYIKINGVRYEILDEWKSDRYDVGFVRIVGQVPFLKLGEMPELLDEVYLVGSPYRKELINTITKGIVSNTDRSLEPWADILQVDNAMYRGGSGGPLLNGDGKIVGIYVGLMASGDNISFCEPVNHILEALERCDI